mgnify:FL=1
MAVKTKIVLVFGAWWFGLKALDALWPPANPTLNAALAILGALCVLADHIERTTDQR